MKRKYLVTACVCVTLLLSIVLASTDGAEVEQRGVSCPAINIYYEQKGPCHHPKYTLTANISGGDWTRKPTYKWSVSAGKITRGQGTGSIKVDASKVGDKPLTVTVEVGNVILEVCPNTTSSTIECYKK